MILWSESLVSTLVIYGPGQSKIEDKAGYALGFCNIVISYGPTLPFHPVEIKNSQVLRFQKSSPHPNPICGVTCSPPTRLQVRTAFKAVMLPEV